MAAGCGRNPAQVARRETPFSPSEDSPERERIEVVRQTERPTLKLVHRIGDPEGGVSMAVFVEGGSRAALALLALVTTRLGEEKDLDVRAFSSGVVFSVLAASPTGAESAMKRLSNALLAPVEAGEKLEAKANHLLALLPEAPRSKVDQCLGVLGSDGPSRAPFSSREVEQIRAEHAVSMRVGMGALGDPSLLRAALAAHETQTWRPGSMVSLPAVTPGSVDVQTGPHRQVRFALATPRATEAMLALEELKSQDHPLRAHLSAASGRFSLAASRVALEPWGACLSVTLDQAELARAPKAEDLAALLRVTAEEIRFALDIAVPKGGGAMTLLSPENALDALTLSAWTAPPSAALPDERSISEVVLGASDGVSRDSITRALDALKGRRSGERLELVRRDEAGQGETWVLVASPCGTAPELPREAGFRAMTVRSLALDFDGIDDVRMEPLATPAAIGLLGHAPRRAGESARHHAMRIARALGRALGGDALDGRDVATTRARMIGELGDQPGPPLALEVMSGGKPSLLDARGNAESLSAASSIDVERIRAELAAEPLRVALLDSSGTDLSPAVLEALGLWLDGSAESKSRCPTSSLEPAKPGVWTLVSPSEGVTARTYVATPSAGSLEAGRALVFLVEQERGALARGLLEPGLALTVSSQYWGTDGGGAFLFELGAEREQLDRAEGQLRAILNRLAARGITNAELGLLREEKARQDRERARSPRGRIVDLWSGRPSGSITKEQIEAHLRRWTAAEHRIVRVRSQR